MALYVGGTSVTSTQTLDATKLTGTLPALNASSLTNLDARDLENALPAISGASLTGIGASTTKGDVGTYSMGFMAQTSGESAQPSSAGTMAGTDLRIRASEVNDMKANWSFNNAYWNFSGTWKNMSSTNISAGSSDTDMPNGLWLRVS